METFAVRDLTFFYPEQEQPALERVNLTVEQGAFLVLCGPSGCGKSTLLRQLKPTLTPHGHCRGEIDFEGAPLGKLDRRSQSAKIGFVQQSPENQIVTDKVWHELAFGLESLGYDTPTIRRRVSEMASFFGIQNWFYRNVAELSGGQKQLLNLASVMALQPSVLILDEPTSQLDPIAGAEFLATLGRINRELGTTVILTEHRLEEVFPLATDVAVMDRGHILCTGTPAEVGMALKERSDALFAAMPEPMRIWAAVETDAPCPVTVGRGRAWLEELAQKQPLLPLPAEQIPAPGETVLRADEVWFRYEKELPDAVRGLSLTLGRGEFLALLGGNGTGKTTTLGLLAGLYRPYRGTCEVSGRIALLPQDPQTLFVKKTVREDLLEMLEREKLSREEQVEELAHAVSLCQLEELLDRHPYDLSGGEQQRAALAKVLLHKPEILLLDEPTKGLDAEFKQVFAQILRTLLHRGVAVLMVSHDVAFCARYAHRCALFFDGAITAEGTPRAFFSGNSFYTTAANRMARSVLPQAVTAEDVIAACGGVLPPEPPLPEDREPLPVERRKSAEGQKKQFPLWRKLLSAVSGAVAVVLFIMTVRVTDLSALVGSGGISAEGVSNLGWSAALLAALAVFAASVSRRAEAPVRPAQIPEDRRKLPKRTLAAAVMILLLIPVTIFIGFSYLENRHYYLTALLVLLEIMLPFFLVFEGRKPRARELVLIAALCALGVVGRLAFFMLPQFSPVLALVILAGVAFGGETGFLVCAVTMLVSNMALGQGPWTPWQMFAMGLIGFLAGVLFRKGVLGRGRAALCAFGVLAAIVIYGGIMNPASALMWLHDLTPQILLAYYITGFPMDCIHATGTALFLWLAAEPMLEKLDRIKVKYGLVE